MGHEDRERKFEQALARHLRAQGAREPEDAAAGCPDATTLAAFHEGMLSSEEMNFTKAHVAGCSRCQEILASLEATDEIEVRDEESVAAPRASILSSGACMWTTQRGRARCRRWRMRRGQRVQLTLRARLRRAARDVEMGGTGGGACCRAAGLDSGEREQAAIDDTGVEN